MNGRGLSVRALRRLEGLLFCGFSSITTLLMIYHNELVQLPLSSALLGRKFERRPNKHHQFMHHISHGTFFQFISASPPNWLTLPAFSAPSATSPGSTAMELVHLHRRRLNETPASLLGLEQRLYCVSISISSFQMWDAMMNRTESGVRS